ncbi:hypothetical protein GZ77_20790 [Endozoicomonas montiporae]|uniref:Aromatic amino acid permease n=2 Tax=Endozoicomonas montiporae TaxID=1027273 RepID=A0A081N356_9GAMM|nr:aromatic amino acid transport family protein [Endozoicomonas montiporae]AMO58173.1 tyrosine-specific transport protein [Endozoicomonas montiporae CL-33]KEQ12879.1 hypothetical protein GZ77_20790 [Endozoicomonas montiporae]
MKSQTLGSALLIAGTSIGAGMLALPIISALTGLWAAMTLMFLTWLLAAYGGLLIAEACRACPEAENLHGVVGLLLGRNGQAVAVVAMLFLYYALCAAYIAGGASQLNSILMMAGLKVPYWLSVVVVTCLVGFVVLVGTALVDICNRVMFVSMLLLMLVILVSLFPHGQLENLAIKSGPAPMLLAALPVLYTSFGYHVVVPTVVRYVEGCPAKFSKALLIGSVLPFILYALWSVSTVGALSHTTILEVASQPDSVNSLMTTVGQVSSVGYFSLMISVFAAFALATSFLGVALGLFDYLSELSHNSRSGFAGRERTILLTLLIPMLVAIYYPDGFILALGYAAVALIVLAVFLPVLMVWKVRRLHMEEPYQAPGGIVGLAIATITGAVVVAAQVGVSLSILPLLG